MNDQLSSEEWETARQYALSLIARREHSCRELKQKLIARGYSETVSNRLITDFQRRDWLNDARFASIYARARAEKGDGPYKIEQKLARRGVSDIAWPPILDELNSDWPTLLRRAYRHKYGDSSPKDQADRVRKARFLAQRGFPLSLIQQILTEFTHSANGSD